MQVLFAIRILLHTLKGTISWVSSELERRRISWRRTFFFNLSSFFAFRYRNCHILLDSRQFSGIATSMVISPDAKHRVVRNSKKNSKYFPSLTHRAPHSNLPGRHIAAGSLEYSRNRITVSQP